MSRITLLRLEREEKELMENTIDNILVSRVSTFEFHFCFFGMEEPYTGGVYHGVLILSENYPFEPPNIKMLTPSGRFQVDAPICTSFTAFHKESWSMVWTIKTLLLGFYSFMLEKHPGIGSIYELPTPQIKKLASESLSFNMKNPIFMEKFYDKLEQIKADKKPKKESARKKSE